MSRNYYRKLSQEIITGNHYRKLSASIYHQAKNVGNIGILAYPKMINTYLKAKNFPTHQHEFITLNTYLSSFLKKSDAKICI